MKGRVGHNAGLDAEEAGGSFPRQQSNRPKRSLNTSDGKHTWAKQKMLNSILVQKLSTLTSV
jgi:hypothetical protein